MKLGFYAKATGLSLLAGLLFSTSAMADVSRICSGSNKAANDRNQRSGVIEVLNTSVTVGTPRHRCRTATKAKKVKRRRLVRIPVMLGVYR